MKRLAPIVGVAVLSSVLVGFFSAALAQPPALQSFGSSKIDKLQASCETILPTLRRLHTNDALLRVNIGQIYNGISVKLMAKLNSRLALNRMDSSRLVTLTSQFEAARVAFSAAYNEYELSMSNLLRINCKTRPTEFYAQLLVARDARYKLSKSVTHLDEIVNEYRVAVDKIRQQMAGGQQ